MLAYIVIFHHGLKGQILFWKNDPVSVVENIKISFKNLKPKQGL